jgi:hypothetical protein
MMLVVFLECHQVFYACKCSVQNMTDFETCRNAQSLYYVACYIIVVHGIETYSLKTSLCVITIMIKL